ncbi:hypothetical protein G6F40_013708 [Rhizopus arrhizus]|nr:hypothetical protein G6F40_013708 [Rhizopus arrhizus]
MEAADVRHRGVADHDALQLQAVQYRLHARRVEPPVEIAAVPDRAGLAVIQRRGGGVGLHFGLGQAQRGLVRRVGARRIERQCHRLGRDAAVQEQGVTDLQQHRAGTQPLADHRICAVQLRVAAAEQLPAAQGLRVDVALVVVPPHGLVVAEHEVHRATGSGGLLLKAIQQPERFGHLRAAVEHITGDDQGVLAHCPTVLGIDHFVGAQQAHQQTVLAMDVGQRHDARHRRQHGDRGRSGCGHVHGVRVPAARRDIGIIHLACSWLPWRNT